MSRTPGSIKSGGRRRGSIDRAERQLVSNELAHSILATFKGLGGTKGMIEWASKPENQGTFYTQILARLYPAALKEDPDVLIQQQFNGISDFDAARRIAFALSKAMDAQEITPQEACALERPEPRWPDPQTYNNPPPSIGEDELKELAAASAAEELAGRQHRGSAREHGLIKDTPVPVVQRVPVRLRRHPLI